jgi:hypothetical protein
VHPPRSGAGGTVRPDRDRRGIADRRPTQSCRQAVAEGGSVALAGDPLQCRRSTSPEGRAGVAGRSISSSAAFDIVCRR